MNNYNSAFFGLYENLFKIAKQRYGETEALALFREIMETGLAKAYGTAFEKGKTHEFVRLVGVRDNLVGLHVTFPVVEPNKIIYQFHTDPFPGLKGIVAHQLLDNTYLDFKVRTILGANWSYSTTKHTWDGDKYTEHVICKTKQPK